MDGAVREKQLFNLVENPNEFLAQHQDPLTIAVTGVAPKPNQVNLTSDTQYADKLAEMETPLLAEMRSLDDPYLVWNQADDGLTPLADVAPREKKARTKAAKEQPQSN